MTQTIDRMFASAEVATNAVKKLTSLGFRIHDIHLVTPAAAEQGEGVEGRLEAVMAAIMKGMVPRGLARIYADGVVAGGSLVTVHAPFGYAQLAIDTLEEFGPIDSGYVEPSDSVMAWDEAAPLSSALRLPVLSGDATPFATFMGVESLADVSFSKWLGLPMRVGAAAPLSRMLGLPTKVRKAAPFSAMFGLPTLTRKATPFSSMFGLKVLTGK